MSHKHYKLISLTFKCLLVSPLDNCPFCNYRKLPIEERLIILNEMDDFEKDKLFKLHFECYLNRVKNKNTEF